MACKGVTLIGMPGSGKTTIAKLVSQQLQWPLLDVDGWIIEREHNSLAKVIEQRGSAHLLIMESQCINSNTLCDSVVATGGSIVYNNHLLPKFQAETIIYYLETPLKIIEDRIGHDIKNTRGVIGRDKLGLAGIYAERLPLYCDWADCTVNCNKRSLADIVAEIVASHTASN